MTFLIGASSLPFTTPPLPLTTLTPSSTLPPTSTVLKWGLPALAALARSPSSTSTLSHRRPRLRLLMRRLHRPLRTPSFLTLRALRPRRLASLAVSTFLGFSLYVLFKCGQELITSPSFVLNCRHSRWRSAPLCLVLRLSEDETDKS